MNYPITVIVLTYNSKLDDIKKTLRSIINQKKIKYEIIIADDCSKENYFEQIKEFFILKKFNDFKFIKNNQNEGTCINYYNAIKISEGEYIKPISPQDFLFDENTLYNWYNYLTANNISVSFGNATYYRINENKSISFIYKKNYQPSCAKIYEINNYNKKKILINNLILNDCILGASYICKKELLLKYLPIILGKIRLCEDFTYRLMLLNDIQICHYNSTVIYYCYGTGVSNRKKKNGKNYLVDDEIIFRNIFSNLTLDEKFKRKIVNFLKHDFKNRYINRIVSFIYFPNAMIFLIKRKFKNKFGKYQKIYYNINYLNLIGVNVEK